jgi:hypothetical protein
VALSAAQLVYTNVEKTLSPKGRDGYQIWLKTPGVLNEAEETEIQTRLGDFEDRRDSPADEPASRHVFFALQTGRAVISRTVPLAETDKFNRAGRFYAHAVVLEPRDFAQIGNDPFVVLDQVKFQSSLDDGVKAGDPAKGFIQVALLDIRRSEAVKTALSSEQVAALLPALFRACTPEDKRLIIGVPGAPARVLQLLRQLFAWLPPSLRRTCSFDTFSNGRNLTQVPFAVAGLPASGPPRRYINLLLLDLARQTLSQAVPPTGSATFEQWILRYAKQSSQAPQSTRAEGAYRLGSCLDQGAVPFEDLSIVDSHLFEELACGDTGVPKMERLLRARLRADAGQALEPLLFAMAWTWLRSAGLDGLRALNEPLNPTVLLRWLLAIYEQRTGDEINREAEVPSLKDVLEQTKSVEGEGVALRKRLVLILYRWGRRWSNLARSVRDVKMIPDDVYQWFVEWALRTIPVEIAMGAGPTPFGAWCGPEVTATDAGNGEECSKLLCALLGIDSLGGDESGHGEAGRMALPLERWEWLMFHLLNQIRRNRPAS